LKESRKDRRGRIGEKAGKLEMGWEWIRTWEECGKGKRIGDGRRVLPRWALAHKILRLLLKTTISSTDKKHPT